MFYHIMDQCKFSKVKVTSFLFFLLYLTMFGYGQDVEPLIVVCQDSATCRMKAENYLEKSRAHRENREYQLAMNLSKRAINNIFQYNGLIKDSTQLSILIFQAKLFSEYALNNYYLGNYVEATIFFNKCISYLNRITSDDYEQNQTLINQIKAQAYNGQATIFSTQGNISEALDNFLKALEMYEMISDSAGIAKLNNNIGIVYKNEEKYENAEKYYLKALKIYSAQDNKLRMLDLYNNLGSFYAESNKIDSALRYLTKAQKLNETLQRPRAQSQTLNNFGNAFAKQNENKKAIEYYKKAVKIKLKEEGNELLMNSYNDMVSVYIKMGDLNSAKYYLSKSKQLNSNLNLLPAAVKIYKYYYKIYEKQNNTKLALKFHLLYKKANDSLNEIEQLTEAAKIQLSYDLKKKI